MRTFLMANIDTISLFLALASIAANIIQFEVDKKDKKYLTCLHQSLYNIMERIRYQVNLFHRGWNPEVVANCISGYSKAAQYFIISFGREVFGHIPEREEVGRIQDKKSNKAN